jgi:8-oxo-dGTP pyrophosphatase MutT (NUDIX family)
LSRQKCTQVISSFNVESLKRRLSPETSLRGFERAGGPISAVAIIIDRTRGGASILLIRRRVRRGDPWSGQIAFPGGHKSASDKTLLQTAIREALEEVGIALRDHELLGVLPLTYSHTHKMPVASFVFALESGASITLNDEVAESFWVPLDELAKISPATSQVQVERGKRDVDSYIYHKHVIWGLTFRIINMLLNKSQPTSS